MSKAQGLLKRINEDLKSLQGMAKTLPKNDRESLDSIVSKFGGFEKSLNDEVSEEKEIKVSGQMDINAAPDSERSRI